MYEHAQAENDDACWSIRVVTAPAIPGTDGRSRTLHPSQTRQLGVRVSVNADGMVAQFHVSAPDAERASMRALARWRRLHSVLDVPDWPVSSLIVERHAPDLRPWAAGRSTGDATRRVLGRLAAPGRSAGE